MNSSTFFDYASVPSDIQEEVEQTIGDTFTVIKFLHLLIREYMMCW
ncbi:MAG: hypothetical protein R2741_04895 [Methanolobus sp.]